MNQRFVSLGLIGLLCIVISIGCGRESKTDVKMENKTDVAVESKTIVFSIFVGDEPLANRKVAVCPMVGSKMYFLCSEGQSDSKGKVTVLLNDNEYEEYAVRIVGNEYYTLLQEGEVLKIRCENGQTLYCDWQSEKIIILHRS